MQCSQWAGCPIPTLFKVLDKEIHLIDIQVQTLELFIFHPFISDLFVYHI